MDDRSLVEKLTAMATQDVSPEERDIAISKLGAMGAWPPPPNRPTTTSADPWGPEPPDGPWARAMVNGRPVWVKRVTMVFHFGYGTSTSGSANTTTSWSFGGSQ